ncbi:MAG: M81 family peptidase [Betaproteobacteria bacterium]|nr:M81 family peptidase [Betaproteobacteria bacterium]
MKLVIAQMKHETNTFSPVPTPIGRFANGTPLPLEGGAAAKAFRGTGSGLGAFIELAEKAGAQYTIPISAGAWPSGPVEDAAFDYISERICAAVAKGCDAILLDLHGAMVTESHDDGEGELVRRIREIAPRTPMAVSLDMHTNLYPGLVERSQVIAGYQTYPHVDMYETGIRAGKALFAMLEGKAKPSMAWGNRPMLPHVMRQSSLDSPNQEIQARCVEMEKQGALCASLFVGFPHADIVNAGLSAVVVTDNDSALARKWCDELLDMAWNTRAQWVYKVEPLAESFKRAKGLSARPVVLLDHYDNAASGGTMDTMAVLAGIMEAGLDDVAAFAVYDPAAVEKMKQAGVGAKLTLQLGGKLDMPSLGLKGKPLEVTGSVKHLSNGQFRNRGPMSKGVLMDMGPTAVLDTGKVEIIVISRQQEPNDLECFYSQGIDPTKKKFLMLKSRVHWRAGFGDLARAIVECAGVGVCTSDYSVLDFRKVRRPIYPLDRM